MRLVVLQTFPIMSEVKCDDCACTVACLSARLPPSPSSASSFLLYSFPLSSESELAWRMTFDHTHGEPKTKKLAHSNRREQDKYEAEENG